MFWIFIFYFFNKCTLWEDTIDETKKQQFPYFCFYLYFVPCWTFVCVQLYTHRGVSSQYGDVVFCTNLTNIKCPSVASIKLDLDTSRPEFGCNHL